MKVCYVDESGYQQADLCLVMVGLLVDATRLNRTRVEFADILNDLQSVFPGRLRELKGSKMIPGAGGWRQVDPNVRKRLAGYLCTWVGQRKHDLVVAAIDKNKHRAGNKSRFPQFCRDPWLASGMHIALQIQKANRRIEKNKGHTFLVFDENKMQADDLSELLWDTSSWTDDYYDREDGEEALDQIIDTAFTVKSHHAGLVQVADLYAYILRRYVEFTDYNSEQEWDGEFKLIQSYVRLLEPALLRRATRWPQKTNSTCAKWYNSVAPDALLVLG